MAQVAVNTTRGDHPHHSSSCHSSNPSIPRSGQFLLASTFVLPGPPSASSLSPKFQAGPKVNNVVNTINGSGQNKAAASFQIPPDFPGPFKSSPKSDTFPASTSHVHRSLPIASAPPLDDPSAEPNIHAEHPPRRQERINAEAGPSRQRPARLTIFKGSYALPPPLSTSSCSPTSSTFPRGLGEDHRGGEGSRAGQLRSHAPKPSLSRTSSYSSNGSSYVGEALGIGSSSYHVGRLEPLAYKTRSRADHLGIELEVAQEALEGPFGEISNKELIGWQRDGTRILRCTWGDCDARLASWTMLREHIELHINRDYAKRLKLDPKPGGGRPSLLRCRVGRCAVRGESVASLVDHVRAHHLGETSWALEWCPISGCTLKAGGGMRHHLEQHHAGMSVADLRQSLSTPRQLLFSGRTQAPKGSAPPLPSKQSPFLLGSPAIFPGNRMPFPALSHQLAVQASAHEDTASRELRAAFGYLPLGDIKDEMAYLDSPEMWPDNYITSGSIGEHRPILLKSNRPMPCSATSGQGLIVRKRTWRPVIEEPVKRRKLGDSSRKALPSIGYEVWESKLAATQSTA